jgi:hypothetical protein
MMRSATLHTLDCRRAGSTQGYSRIAQAATSTSTQVTNYVIPPPKTVMQL